MDEKKFLGLRRFNLIMGLFHLVQAILMLVLSNDFSQQVYGYFLQFDPATQSLQPGLEKLFNIPIAPLVALFLLFSAVAHLTISIGPVYEWYVKNLKKGINYARWYEYAFSSSLMIVLIGMLVGILEFSALFMMFVLNAGMIFFGLMMELHNQTTKKTDWTSYIYGCIMGIAPWIAIAYYLLNAGEGDLKPPDFVYGIFFSIFVFFNTFTVNMLLQYKKVGKWSDYLFGEKMYIVLSLLAKSALAWQVFAGTLRPV